MGAAFACEPIGTPTGCTCQAPPKFASSALCVEAVAPQPDTPHPGTPSHPAHPAFLLEPSPPRYRAPRRPSMPRAGVLGTRACPCASLAFYGPPCGIQKATTSGWAQPARCLKPSGALNALFASARSSSPSTCAKTHPPDAHSRPACRSLSAASPPKPKTSSTLRSPAALQQEFPKERRLHSHRPGPAGCQVPLAGVRAGVRGALRPTRRTADPPPPRRHPVPPWRRRCEPLVFQCFGDGTHGAMGVA